MTGPACSTTCVAVMHAERPARYSLLEDGVLPLRCNDAPVASRMMCAQQGLRCRTEFGHHLATLNGAMADVQGAYGTAAQLYEDSASTGSSHWMASGARSRYPPIRRLAAADGEVLLFRDSDTSRPFRYLEKRRFLRPQCQVTCSGHMRTVLAQGHLPTTRSCEAPRVWPLRRRKPPPPHPQRSGRRSHARRANATQRPSQPRKAYVPDRTVARPRGVGLATKGPRVSPEGDAW